MGASLPHQTQAGVNSVEPPAKKTTRTEEKGNSPILSPDKLSFTKTLATPVRLSRIASRVVHNYSHRSGFEKNLEDWLYLPIAFMIIVLQFNIATPFPYNNTKPQQRKIVLLMNLFSIKWKNSAIFWGGFQFGSIDFPIELNRNVLVEACWAIARQMQRY